MTPPNFNVRRLHHVAWRCRDAEETRVFYEEVLGLPLAHVVCEDKVPSTGEASSFAHVFFQMKDGSYVAFFDLGDGQGAVNPTVPPWANHLAMSVDSLEELEAAKRRLVDANVEVLGVIDHGWLHSIYFHDPNGLRLELAYQSGGPAEMEQFQKDAHASLARWTDEKRKVSS